MAELVRAQDRFDHFCAGVLVGLASTPAVVVEVEGSRVVVDVSEGEEDAPTP